MGTKKQHKKSSTKLVSLTPEAKLHLAKPRPGFEPFVEELLSLYESNRDLLGDLDVDPDAVRAALTAYTALGLDEKAAQAQVDSIHETRLVQGSTAWSASLAIYVRAALAGRTNGVMSHGVSGFAAFMKQRSRQKKAIAPVTPTT